MTSEDTVREFCAAVSKRDAERLRPLLADDVVYHNVGMPAAVGLDATLENVAAQWEMLPDIFEFEICNLAVSGDTVLTERVDRVGVGGVVAPVPVMGAFEVRGDRIVRRAGSLSDDSFAGFGINPRCLPPSRLRGWRRR
jgi:limonene-1,2-epoxide hydrolase